jgi:hypothetical protein
MILVVSGEGPSDIGTSDSGKGECSGDDFRMGPMAALIQRIVDDTAGFEFARGSMEFVSEARRLEVAKKELPRSYIVGKKHAFEEGFYFKEARALASIARQKGRTGNCIAAAVLFRDADSNERAGYEIVCRSIEHGFTAEGMEDLGAPMVPKPTSEAWLICGLKEQPYQNCGALEETLSGSGAGDRPAKAMLEAFLIARGKCAEDLCDLISEGAISPFQIQMPSYDRFRNRLVNVTNRMLGRPVINPD